METALFHYRYSERNPAEWNIRIDKNTSRQRTKIEYLFVKAYRVEPSLVTLGESINAINANDAPDDTTKGVYHEVESEGSWIMRTN